MSHHSKHRKRRSRHTRKHRRGGRKTVPLAGWSKSAPGTHQRTVMLKKCGRKCFLGPKKSFPICTKGTCKVNRKGVQAAYIRAREWGKPKRSYKGKAKPTKKRRVYQRVAKRAKAILRKTRKKLHRGGVNGNNPARFYDIAEIINPGYETDWYVTDAMENGMHERIGQYIMNPNNNLHDGDILFVGSTNQTRQEYGFVMVMHNNAQLDIGRTINDCNCIGGEYGAEIPLERGIVDYLARNHITYEALFREMENRHNFLWQLFVGDDIVAGEMDELINEYREKQIWN